MIKTAQLHPSVGIEVHGVDLRRIGAGELSEIAGLLLRYGVVVVRDQDLTFEDHLEFTAMLGDAEGFSRRPDAAAEGTVQPTAKNVFRVSNEESLGTTGVGFYWHTDGYFYQQPTAVSIMRPVQLPESGGNTRYASMEAALRAMPASLRYAVRGRVAVSRPKPGTRGGGMLGRTRETEVRHPLVRQHPVTGIEGLFINVRNMGGIDGLTRAESDALLSELSDFLDVGDFVYEHSWRAGDVVLWDNSGVLHHATDVTAGTRIMERTSVAGSAFFGGQLWTQAGQSVLAGP